MQQSFFKKNANNLWIILGFLIIACLYCLPQFQGQKLSVHDSISWEAASHEAKMYKEATGENPLWSNSMFGGMPTYTYYLPGIKNYVLALETQIEKVIPPPAFLFFFAMLGFFVLASSLKINKWIGAMGAIAYAFATYNPIIISVGHITKMYAIGCIPGVLAGFKMIFNNKRLSGAAIMALFFSLMITWGHYQVVYYTGILLLFAGIGIAIDAFKKGEIKSLFINASIALLIGVLSIGPSLPAMLTTAEYTKYTMRGGNSELKQLKAGEVKNNGGLDKEYAFSWSNGIGETFCLMVPQLYGGASGQKLGTDSKYYETLTQLGVPESSAEDMASSAPTYWGPQSFLSGPVYFGAIICFLFVLGMLVVQSPYKWWIAAVSLLAIMMSWGKNFEAFNYFLFDHLPMYNKFRTPSMILVLPQLLFPMLGVWALNDIFNNKITQEDLLKKLKISTLITAGLCVLLALGGSAFFDFKSAGDTALAAQFTQSANNNPQIGQQIIKALVEDRGTMAMKSSLASAIFIILAAALIWAYSKNKLKKELAIAGLGLLVAIDLLPTARLYLNDKNFKDSSEYEAQFTPRPVDAEIMKDKDPYYRVFDLSRNTYNDAIQSYFHKTVGGYSPAKMESFQDLINVHLSNKINAEVLNMLNTKYIIFNTGNGQAGFQPNPSTCGNAWFVQNVTYVNNADEEMTAMNAGSLGDTAMMPNAWKAAQTAIIRNTFAAELNNATNFVKDSAAQIKLTKYGLDDLSFASNNSHEGLAVFADIYYDKGWKAFIDGKETPIIKANYVLRALKIPSGAHKIEFHFHPDTYYKSNNIAMMSSILMYLLFAAALIMAFRKNDEDASATSMKQ